MTHWVNVYDEDAVTETAEGHTGDVGELNSVLEAPVLWLQHH